jgi:hypothetical protein
MFSAAEAIARTHGWAVISSTATPGFLAGIGDDMLRQAGISISPGLITKAAEATEGYPFLIQLVGYYLLAGGKQRELEAGPKQRSTGNQRRPKAQHTGRLRVNTLGHLGQRPRVPKRHG